MAKRSILMRGIILMVVLVFGGCSAGALTLVYYKGASGTAVSK
jgi:hypothetical protein